MILLTALISLTAYGGTYFKDGMKWTVRYSGTHKPEVAYSQKTFSLEGDTILNDSKAFKMYSIADDIESSKEFITALKVSDDKVWFWDRHTEDWYLLYDFGLNEGDGCFVYHISSCQEHTIPQGSYLKCTQVNNAETENDLTFLEVEEYECEEETSPLSEGLG